MKQTRLSRQQTRLSGMGLDEAAVPTISPWLLRWFLAYIRRYLRRHFRALRLASDGRPRVPDDVPLVVFLNHPSWWDPLVGLFLAYHLFPGRWTYAPMDRQSLQRYRIFARLGFFGIQPESTRSAREFLRMSEAILRRPERSLWITPQGAFCDPRQRPPGFQPGLAFLAAHLRGCVFLPLALEYAFREERFAEILVRFGEPVTTVDDLGRDVDAWNNRLEAAMIRTQEALAEQVIRRRADDFEVLLTGRVGIGGFYDLGRRLRAAWRRETFRSQHGDAPP